MASFDPISILGIVGTTLGVLSSLSSTVENIKTRLTHYHECLRILQGYKHTMETIFLELEIWRSLWSQNRYGVRSAYDDRTYLLFWGASGLMGMVARTNLIMRDIASVNELLKCRKIRGARINWKKLGPHISCPTGQDIEDWSNVIDRMLDGPQPVQMEPDRTYSFLFAIYKNSEIKNKLNDLKERVDQLQKTSIALFRGRHEGRISKPKADQLQRAATLEEQRRKLLQFLDEVFEDNTDSDLHWALELGNPSLDLALPQLRAASRRQLEFVFKARQGTGVFQHDIKILWPKSCKTNRPRLLDQGMIGSKTNAIAKYEGQFRLPSKLEIKPLELLDAYGKSVHALTAVTAARSTILLYKPLWVSRLCFCGIGVYDSVEPVLAYSPQEDCVHVRPRSREQSFLLLTVLLAEIALGAPIQVRLSPTSPEAPQQFEIPETHLLPGYTAKMNWETLWDLLNERAEMPEHFVTFEYLEAVDYCYELSRRLTKREFVNDDLDICIARLENPLKKMHNDLVEEYRKLAGMTWYKELVSRTKVLQLPEVQGDEAAIELE